MLMIKTTMAAAVGAIGLFALGLAPAQAGANILPGSGDTVVGSSQIPGLYTSAAYGNLIDGTTNSTCCNAPGEVRYLFDADGMNETLTVDLQSTYSLDSFGISYLGDDRTPGSFQILTSKTGLPGSFTAYNTLPTTPDYGTASSQYSSTIAGNPVSAQYVEFAFGVGSSDNVSNGGTGNGAGILQLSVSGVPAAVSAAPEPAAWALLMVAVGMIGSSLRLRRRRGAVAAA